MSPTPYQTFSKEILSVWGFGFCLVWGVFGHACPLWRFGGFAVVRSAVCRWVREPGASVVSSFGLPGGVLGLSGLVLVVFVV